MSWNHWLFLLQRLVICSASFFQRSLVGGYRPEDHLFSRRKPGFTSIFCSSHPFGYYDHSVDTLHHLRISIIEMTWWSFNMWHEDKQEVKVLLQRVPMQNKLCVPPELGTHSNRWDKHRQRDGVMQAKWVWNSKVEHNAEQRIWYALDTQS